MVISLPTLREKLSEWIRQPRIRLRLVEASGVPATEIKLDPALVEPLSALENERWMAEKLRAGWTYAVRENAKHHHPLLVPYDDLPGREMEKDRDTVRNIPNLHAKTKCLVKAL